MMVGALVMMSPASLNALAQANPERPRSAFVTLLVSLVPIILIFGMYIWLMRRSGIGKSQEHMARSRAFMDKVEQQNDQVIAALERIEKALAKRE
jgi:ATP-dependent Zn protease